MIQITSVLKSSHLIDLAISGVETLVGSVYPPNCLICRTFVEDHAAMCDKCMAAIGLLKGERCARCGCPGEWVGGCSNCSGKAYRFHQMITLADFNDEVRQLVHALKYQGRSRVATVLEKLLGEVILDAWNVSTGFLIVPVPLHASREREEC